jgi:hypothetical protein
MRAACTAALIAMLVPISTQAYDAGSSAVNGRRTNHHVGPKVVRTLAHGRLPGRRTFVITGERYRFDNQTSFALHVKFQISGIPGGGGGSGMSFQQGGSVLAYAIHLACTPHRYAFLYGLLRVKEDRVIAHVSARTYTLRRVTIPTILGMNGVLVYGVLPQAPEEVRVQTTTGATVVAERIPTEFTANCQPGTLVTVKLGQEG